MNAWAIPATQPTAVVVNIRGKKISHSYTACKDFLWRGGGVAGFLWSAKVGFANMFG